VRIAVIGDLMLDVLVEPAGAMNAGDDTPGRIGMECGGQAANVAAWVTALGGRARLVCARARDQNGARAQALGRARGVELAGPSVGGRGGVVVSIIADSGERTLVSDPGCARSLRPEHLSGDWFSDCAWLHVSGYHLFDDAAAGAALRGAELARAHGARVSLDLSCAARLRELGGGEARRRVSELGPDLVFQTAGEAEALGGRGLEPVCVIKRGADGCTVISGDERLDLVAHPAAAVDTTGAGDAFAAGFLVGEGVRGAAESGLAAAARCVSVVGAMPGDPAGIAVGSR
jgi:sugar/nucleoside kinase (ribokinase family)